MELPKSVTGESLTFEATEDEQSSWFLLGLHQGNFNMIQDWYSRFQGGCELLREAEVEVCGRKDGR